MIPITHKYSRLAIRTRPWEPWIEPDESKSRYYHTIRVQVLDTIGSSALIRRPDGLSVIVPCEDLEVRQ